MNEITNEKKKNFFIRKWEEYRINKVLEKPNLSIDDFIKLKEYIKNSPEVIRKMLFEVHKIASGINTFNTWDPNSVDAKKNKQIESFFDSITNEYALISELNGKSDEFFKSLPQSVRSKLVQMNPLFLEKMIVIQNGFSGEKEEISQDMVDTISKLDPEKLNSLENTFILKRVLQYCPEMIQKLLPEKQIEIATLDLKLFSRLSPEIQEECYKNKSFREIVFKSVPKSKSEKEYTEWVDMFQGIYKVRGELSDDEKGVYSQLFKEHFKNMDKEFQLSCVKQHPNFTRFADINVQMDFFEQKSTNLSSAEQFQELGKKLELLDEKVLFFVLKNNPNLWQFVSHEKKAQICISTKNNNELIAGLIGYCTEYSGLYKLSDNSNIGKQMDNIIENSSFDTAKKIFLNTKYKSAKGYIGHSKRTNISYVEERTDNQRSYAECSDLNNFTSEQIMELVKVDPNFILTLLDTSDFNQLQNNFTKIEEIFELLYFNNPNITDSKRTLGQNVIKDIINEIKSEGRVESVKSIPNLKLVFNTKIMERCSDEDLSKYFGKIENSNQDFRELIEKTYGSKAKTILDQRPNLDINTISCLDVFDENILENFSEGFVHDLLSYNFEGISGFFDIVKDEKHPERLEKFKKYYEILSKYKGQNASTMQKAIEEFIMVEPLFEPEILNKVLDLNDQIPEQPNSLTSNFLSAIYNGNLVGCRNLQDLEQYDEKMMKVLNPFIEGKNLNKNAICFGLFGMNWDNSAEGQQDFYKIFKLFNFGKYDFSDFDFKSFDSDAFKEKFSDVDLSDEEMKVVALLSLIDFGDSDKFQSAYQVFGGFDLKNPKHFYSATSKVMNSHIQKIQNSFTTKKELDEAIEYIESQYPDLPMDKRPVYKLVKEDGKEEYILNGYDFACLFSIVSSRITNDYLHYESQNGNMAICTRYSNTALAPINSYIPKKDTMFETAVFYSSVSPDDIISLAAYESDGKQESEYADAETSHTSKLVNMKGKIRGAITYPTRLCMKDDNELAFYRFRRDHSKREANRQNGRILPDFCTPGNKQLVEEGVPILIVNNQAYADCHEFVTEEQFEHMSVAEKVERAMERLGVLKKEKTDQRKIEDNVQEDSSGLEL